MPLQLGFDPTTKAAVVLPEDTLLRHAVILGATGAGKTVVALDALAESLAAAMGYDPSGETGGRAKDVLFLMLQSCLKAGRWPRDIAGLVKILEADAPPDAAALQTKQERASLVRRAQSMT